MSGITRANLSVITFCLFCLVLFAPNSQAQNGESPFYFDSLQTFQFGSGAGTDVWGWRAPNGDQYAVMGVQFGLVFVNATTGQVVDTITGSGCNWQDMKSYFNYMYAVSECGSGLRVIDMQYLPDSAHLVQVKTVSTELNINSSHNLWVDSLAGYLYAEGTGQPGRSLIVYDISVPSNPVEITTMGPCCGVHDMYVVNDTAYLAEGFASVFSIWDFSNKSLPMKIATFAPANAGIAHNIWPTADRRHVVTTEETAEQTVKVWNIEDLSDIRLVSEYLAPGDLAHNATVRGDYIYLSHYESGIALLDINQPNCLTEIDRFDTFTAAESPNFRGCWGIYPYTAEDSLVFASNMDGRLFIFRVREDPNYTPQLVDGDNDGIEDACDNCPSLANASQADTDRDEVGDDCDNCPEVANFGQADSDGDGFGDACDQCPGADDLADADGDGVADGCDVCPTLANADQADTDLDGVGDACDNCPNTANSNQVDSDGDSLGDLCDTCPQDAENDADGDGLCALDDNCPTVFNPDQADATDDGIGDACCCVGVAGNLDGDPDDIVDVGDLTFLIGRLFLGGPLGSCPGEANVDGDPEGVVDIGDATRLINFLFTDGQAPADCQ